jgi:hypothetical protein
MAYEGWPLCHPSSLLLPEDITDILSSKGMQYAFLPEIAAISLLDSSRHCY